MARQLSLLSTDCRLFTENESVDGFCDNNPLNKESEQFRQEIVTRALKTVIEMLRCSSSQSMACGVGVAGRTHFSLRGWPLWV